MYAFLDTETTLTQKAIETLLDASLYAKPVEDEDIFDDNRIISPEEFKTFFTEYKDKGYSRNEAQTQYYQNNKGKLNPVALTTLFTVYEGVEVVPWIKKVFAEPEKYKITEKGIYKIRAWLPDILVFEFKDNA